MQWYFVHIEHMRLTRAANLALQATLVHVFEDMGPPVDCRVYRKGSDEHGYSYFFSPTAVAAFKALIDLWQGVSISEPTNLDTMNRVI